MIKYLHSCWYNNTSQTVLCSAKTFATCQKVDGKTRQVTAEHFQTMLPARPWVGVNFYRKSSRQTTISFTVSAFTGRFAPTDRNLMGRSQFLRKAKFRRYASITHIPTHTRHANALLTTVGCQRLRTSPTVMPFKLSRIGFDLPELLEIQRASFNSFLKESIPDLLSQMAPIKVERGNIVVKLVLNGTNYQLVAPDETARDCILKMKTYSCKLYIEAKVLYTNISGKVLYSTPSEWVLVGHLPIMTKRGHFIINGSPRVIVHQVVRSPGIYFQKVLEKDEKKTIRFYGDIIPRRGVWLRLQTTKKGKIEAKLKKGKKLEADMLQRCFQFMERAEMVKPWQSAAQNVDTQTQHAYADNLRLSAFAKRTRTLTTYGCQQSVSRVKLLQPEHRVDGQRLLDLSSALSDGLAISGAEIDSFVSAPEEKALLYTYDKLYRPVEDKEREELSKKGKNRSFTNNLLGDKRYKLKRSYKNLFSTFKEKSRYDLSDLGREKINTKLGLYVSEKQLSALDIYTASNWLSRLTKGEKSVDDIDHFQNRRVRTSGELLHTQFESGIDRLRKLAWNKLKELLHFKSPQKGLVSQSDIDARQISRDSKERVLSRHFNLEKKASQKEKTVIALLESKVPVSINSNYAESFHDDLLFIAQTQFLLPSLKEFFSTKPLNGALRELFGSNPLSQYMDQTNPLAEITHKRRMSSLGLGGVSRESAGMAIRGIHPTHYGRICPIETPEGKNAGLVNSLAFYAKINNKGFVETPYYKVIKGQVQHELGFTFFSAKQESASHLNIAPSDLKQSWNNMLATDDALRSNKLPLFVEQASLFDKPTVVSTRSPQVVSPTSDATLTRSVSPTSNQVPVRVADNLLDLFKKIDSYKVDCIGISPVQMISVATSLIPFLEHNDANRALMGSNMQRQAVPLMIAERPIVGTGLESLVVAESGHLLQSKLTGFISYVSATKIVLEYLCDRAKKNIEPTEKTLSSNKRLTSLGLFVEQASLFDKPTGGATSYACREKAFTHSLHVLKSKIKEPNKQLATKTTPSSLESVDTIERRQQSWPFVLGSPLFKGEFLQKRNKSKLLWKESLIHTSLPKPFFNKVNSQLANANKRLTSLGLFVEQASLFDKPTVITPCLRMLRNRKKENNGASLAYIGAFRTDMRQAGISKSTGTIVFTKALDALRTSQGLFDKACLQSFWLNQKPCQFAAKLKSSLHVINNFDRSNQDTCLTQRALVKEGDWVQKGDILTDCSASDQGELAVGKNILVAYIPWEGYNFEDAIVISERLVKEHVYTSLHIERYDLNAQDVKEGSEWLTNHLPGIPSKNVTHLDSFGLPKIGTFVKEGDILVGKMKYTNKKPTTPYERLLCDILGENNFSARDSSLYVPKGVHARVIKNKVITFFEDYPSIESKKPSLLEALQLGKSNNVQVLGTTYGDTRNDTRGGSVITGGDYRIPIGGSHKRSLRRTGAKPRMYFGTSTGRPRMWSSCTTKYVVQPRTYVLRSQSTRGRVHVGDNTTCLRSVPSHVREYNRVCVCERKAYDVRSLTSVDCQTRYRLSLSRITSNSVGVACNTSLQLGKDNNVRPDNRSLSDKQATVVRLGTLENEKSPHLTQKRGNKRSPTVITEKKPTSVRHTNANKRSLLDNRGLLTKRLRSPKLVHIFLGEKRAIQVGDKMSGRHGNKGVVATILPRQDMPYLADGTPIDIILNPLGVPSRMNVGQVFEALLGLAGTYLGQNYKIMAFDELYGVEASQSVVYLKLYQARLQSGHNWLFQVDFPGKTRLTDGRSGQCFDQWVTVGKAYMLKLIHMVNEKIHARATGPYALITQQPLRGRSQKGGQRLGEMEVWALEGFGAAYTLQELLTKKSDDMVGRKEVASAILPRPASILDIIHPLNRVQENRLILGQPEIFKVLICELQALCLDVGVYSLTTQSFQRSFLSRVN